MSIAKKLGGRKTIVLPNLTAISREEGLIAEDENITVVIRRVSAGEIIGATGQMLSMLSDYPRLPKETDDDYAARIAKIKESIPDDEKFQETIERTKGFEALKAALLCRGIVSEKVVDDPYADGIHYAEFGPDINLLFNEINKLSNLGYGELAVQDAARFLAEQDGSDGSSPSGKAGVRPVDNLQLATAKAGVQPKSNGKAGAGKKAASPTD